MSFVFIASISLGAEDLAPIWPNASAAAARTSAFESASAVSASCCAFALFVINPSARTALVRVSAFLSPRPALSADQERSTGVWARSNAAPTTPTIQKNRTAFSPWFFATPRVMSAARLSI